MTSGTLLGSRSEIGLIRICRVLFISAVAFTPFASLQVDWIPSFMDTIIYQNVLRI